MPKSPEEIRALAHRNRATISGQLERTLPAKLQSRDARQMILDMRQDNEAGHEALKKMKSLKTIPGFFPTPENLVSTMMVRLVAGCKLDGLRALEPSAGKGDIAIMMHGLGALVDVCEINADLRAELLTKNCNLVAHDFMEWQPEPSYDIIAMNPPFEDRQDREHVLHAYEFLKPGGVLVAIMSQGPFTGSQTKDREFKRWLGFDQTDVLDHTIARSGTTGEDHNATLWQNPENAFNGPHSERLTNVRTVMLRLVKKPCRPDFPYAD